MNENLVRAQMRRARNFYLLRKQGDAGVLRKRQPRTIIVNDNRH
jgi:hypothetical protein